MRLEDAMAAQASGEIIKMSSPERPPAGTANHGQTPEQSSRPRRGPSLG